MPTVSKVFRITITPEQFVNSCDMDEIQELEFEIQRRKKRNYFDYKTQNGDLEKEFKTRRK